MPVNVSNPIFKDSGMPTWKVSIFGTLEQSKQGASPSQIHGCCILSQKRSNNMQISTTIPR